MPRTARALWWPAALLVLAACAAPAGPAATDHRQTPARATAIPFDLYTHCGIDEALVKGVYYEADPPLDDGNGNPPKGWGNPYQPGTMTLTSPTTAVFRDSAGHTVSFRARPGATAFKHLCA